MTTLQAVQQHGSVDLMQESLMNLDHMVWPDSQDIVVVSGVVNLTQGQSIRHDRQTVRFGVGNDVGGV